MEGERYKVRIRGTRPLLMNSCRSMVEEREKKITRGKEDLTPREEAERLLYLDSKNNIVVPSLALLACLKKSAVNFKVPGKGKKTFKDYIFSGVRIEPMNIPLIFDGDWETDIQPVVINRARVPKSRPRFDEWELEFDVEIVDKTITEHYLKAMLEDAGKFSGLLDFRPLYGLFEVTEFEKVE
jgi:hypothetical protein